MNYDTQSEKGQRYSSVNELVNPKKYRNEDGPYQSVNSLIQKDALVSTPTPAAVDEADSVRPSIVWDHTQGGITLTYNISNGKLKKDTTINVYWANGPKYENRMGDPVFCYHVPSDTPEGQWPVHISGTGLTEAPQGVTHLVAASSESDVRALVDVKINYGANVNAKTVWGTTIDIIKGGLRASGQSMATITSTSRTPADQAWIMFENLVSRKYAINVNVAHQLALYKAPGRAIVNVFVRETKGMSYQQIVQNGRVIRAAMEKEIYHQGPGKVSKHCADPTQRNVVDIGSAVFNANNSGLFMAAVQSRAFLLDERKDNGCFHIEVQS